MTNPINKNNPFEPPSNKRKADESPELHPGKILKIDCLKLDKLPETFKIVRP
ncbi:MAG: hypothetical protein K1000chlam2_01277 [Chlamydiae bacterium]|nr:hypothetical protein [Chlamydiota bacterium]